MQIEIGVDHLYVTDHENGVWWSIRRRDVEVIGRLPPLRMWTRHDHEPFTPVQVNIEPS